MIKYINKHFKMVITIISAVILLGVIIYLYNTDRLDFLIKMNFKSLISSLKQIEKWLLSASLLAVIILSVFSNLLNELIFPDSSKELLRNSKTLIENQGEFKELLKDRDFKYQEIIKYGKIDPRDIEKHLKDLPINIGKLESDIEIDKWYQSKEISIEEKELLLLVVKNIFEYSKVLSQKVTELKLKRDNRESEFIDEIRKHLKDGNANSIKGSYFSVKEINDQVNINLLKYSIEATKSLFAIQETNVLYLELVTLEETPKNFIQYANFLFYYINLNEAFIYYNKAYSYYGNLNVDEQKSYLSDIEFVLNKLGLINLNKNEYQSAETNFLKSLKINDKLIKDKPKLYLPSRIETLKNLAILYRKTNNFQKASKYYKLAFEIIKDLPDDNKTQLLKIYNDIGNFNFQIGEFQLSKENYIQSLKLTKQLMKDNPKKYKLLYAKALSNLGSVYSSLKQLEKAIKVQEDALIIFKELSNEKQIFNRSNYAGALLNSGAIYHDMNNFSKSMISYNEALKIYEALAENNPKMYKPLVASTLHNIALLEFNTNKYDDSLNHFDKALKIRNEFAEDTPSVFLPKVAETLTYMAYVYIERQQIHQARINLQEAYNIYKVRLNYDKGIFPRNMANVLKNLANILVQSNENEKALEYYDESLEIYKLLASKNPPAYEVAYAEVLVFGVQRFKKNKNNLVIAKNILIKYQYNINGQKILKLIEGLE